MLASLDGMKGGQYYITSHPGPGCWKVDNIVGQILNMFLHLGFSNLAPMIHYILLKGLVLTVHYDSTQGRIQEFLKEGAQKL